jgi:hypothetical protein
MLEGYLHFINFITFLPDSKQIVSGSYNKIVRL